jgi:flagellar motor switch protein FliM
LKEVWGVRYQIDFTITETESNPQLMQIVAPNEVVVLICFEIKMGESSGMMNLCIPFMVVEPIMAEFSTQNWFAFDRKERTKEQFDNLNIGIVKAPMDCIIYLAESKLTVREVLELKVGDVIMTEKLTGMPLVMAVSGKPKYLGRAGMARNHKVLQITGDASVEQNI